MKHFKFEKFVNKSNTASIEINLNYIDKRKKPFVYIVRMNRDTFQMDGKQIYNYLKNNNYEIHKHFMDYQN